MSWFDTALSVTATLGKVAGTLLGSTNSIVAFDIEPDTGSGADVGQIVFQLDNQGHIWALNTSTQFPCQLFFPGDSAGGMPGAGVSIMLGAFQKLDVTAAFNKYAAADLTDFLITPSNTAVSVAADGTSSSTIQSQGYNIPPNQVTAIGPYFNVTANVSNTNVTIALVGGLVLSGIVLMNVRGAGNTFCKIMNVIKKTQRAADDGNSMTVELPAGVDIANGLQSIEIVAAVDSQSLQRVVDEYAKKHHAKPISREEFANLAKMKVH
jgi:hypothetical protein